MDRIARRGHIPPMQLTVTVCHDEREGIWYVESSDVPGLNAEAPSYDELVEVIADLAPDLVAANLPDVGAQRDATTPRAS
jgi:predicted RNase H-like HicB family nuclease